MGKFIYNVFLSLYGFVFRIAAIFNNKARMGIEGRKNIFATISSVVKPGHDHLIWMHCASLGEFEQGRPVLESLKHQYSETVIVLTFFSASGYEAMKNYKGANHIFYLPFDNLVNAKKMLDILNPSLILWVKYEFWYYHLHEIKQRNIPLLLVSGIFRKSQPFFKWYGGIWQQMLLCFTHFFLQNNLSKNLLATAGITDNITVTGDTRFDRVIEIAEKFEPIPFIKSFCGDSKVIVAGSTWEDDETELIHYAKANPQIKFIIAPHEIGIENLKDVKKEFVNAMFYSELVTNATQYNTDNIKGANWQEATINRQLTNTNVLIIDNVGMLSRLYYYADITYVGGGFGADGVHNVLEAAVYGKPVIYGPEFEKFNEAVELVNCGAGITIEGALELEAVLSSLWENENLLAEKGRAAKDYVYSNAGASKKIIQFIQENRLLTN